MAEIKAKETYYNGYRFRSRLEAKWAVFFDAMDIRYVYENEGFERKTQNGTISYLPDFYFPQYELYGEVKGVYALNEIPRSDAERMSLMIDYEGPLQNGIVLLGNIPEPNEFIEYAVWKRSTEGLELVYLLDTLDSEWDSKILMDKAPCRFTSDYVPTHSYGECCQYTKVYFALEQARQARFEHGERPITERNYRS